MSFPHYREVLGTCDSNPLNRSADEMISQEIYWRSAIAIRFYIEAFVALEVNDSAAINIDQVGHIVVAGTLTSCAANDARGRGA
jgi:hypothetical protein